MLNHLIDPDAPTFQEEASDFHWAELHITGETLFESDVEDRLINKDSVIYEVLESMGDDNLFNDITIAPIAYCRRVEALFDIKLAELMQEALEDFYNEL